jgi:hypothetical protein
MHSAYVEQLNGGYCIAGTRISQDSVVSSFNEPPGISGDNNDHASDCSRGVNQGSTAGRRFPYCVHR